ncbi:TatD family hydrolase [Thiotrichales bacterium 19S3-7]|nr:TatD family hydrolase [Thiotrichales bacterium 19S3-7]MCF6803013.1 TatD family hydrolase [Thiotrichales bacterium 19S3-11]
MLADTHCHLDFDEFDHDREELLKQITDNNIQRLINPSISRNNWQNVISLSKQYPLITAAIGMHPCFINDHNPNDLAELENQLITENISLLGEIGLDKRVDKFNEQLFYFAEQLKIAKKLNLPVIIHSVRAHTEIIHQLKLLKFTAGGIIHAFNGPIDIAESYLNLGFKLGIGSILTYPKNKLLNIITSLPLSSFVLETDSPDMPPHHSAKNRNTPLSLILIYNIVCQNRPESKLEIENELWHNSCQFFKFR